jgi:hypothetical protein
MGGALAWHSYDVCPYTTAAVNWPCYVADILTLMDLFGWYYIALREC